MRRKANISENLDVTNFEDVKEFLLEILLEMISCFSFLLFLLEILLEMISCFSFLAKI